MNFALRIQQHMNETSNKTKGSEGCRGSLVATNLYAFVVAGNVPDCRIEKMFTSAERFEAHVDGVEILRPNQIDQLRKRIRDILRQGDRNLVHRCILTTSFRYCNRV